MLYATGLTEDDMNKPQIGIGSVWYEGNPCNMHLLQLSEYVKQSVVETQQLVGYRFNTIGVSDGISMGTSGMRYSLQSRDLIADSIETTMGGQWYDGLIALPGCDKNMPGCVMAMGRLNRPSIMIYGGTIRAGRAHHQCAVGCGQCLSIVRTVRVRENFRRRTIGNIEVFLSRTRCLWWYVHGQYHGDRH